MERVLVLVLTCAVHTTFSRKLKSSIFIKSDFNEYNNR